MASLVSPAPIEKFIAPCAGRLPALVHEDVVIIFSVEKEEEEISPSVILEQLLTILHDLFFPAHQKYSRIYSECKFRE